MGRYFIENYLLKIHNGSMIKTTRDLLESYGSHRAIKAAIKKGDLQRISHGVYAEGQPELGEIEAVCARYPNAILTLESAFAYYGLSDYVPSQYVFVTPLNAHPIDSPKVVQHYMSEELVGIGKTEAKTKQGSIHIYDMERLLIELFRLKRKLPPDYFKEVVGSYREAASSGVLDFPKLIAYLGQFKRGKTLHDRIQEVIL